MKKINYNTSIERLEILKKAEQKGWILKEEANLTNENYLIFDTKTEEKMIQLETALLELTMMLGGM